MSARDYDEIATIVEETSAAAEARKSTHDGSRPSVGDATRALMGVPQLPYADAVHAELLAQCMPPAAVETGVRDNRSGAPELFLRAVWPAGTAFLGGLVRDRGLTLAWSHVTGWSAHDAYGVCRLLDVDALADPRLIAHAAVHLAREPLDEGALWAPLPGLGRWSEAVYLDIALAHYDERENDR
ncbi:hypothetical protein [Streptomyces sp. NPDC101776]|uniref:hypothetical protein n=1 Tax=Streptomyces sp. NPDC101776 TaxID=3366146 RepID=UPI00380BD110